MAPLTPFWAQPSHGEIQKVLFSEDVENYTTKSISLIDLPPFAVYAKFSYPPCTSATNPTYATVQVGENEHMNLNSDLVYINHSCEPSVFFDVSTLAIIAGPAGLRAGQELTFFYPSTEWDMAQGFECTCGAASCLGIISGAKKLSARSLDGKWLNAHIHNLLAEQISDDEEEDEVDTALKRAVTQAEIIFKGSKRALTSYRLRKNGYRNMIGDAKTDTNTNTNSDHGMSTHTNQHLDAGKADMMERVAREMGLACVS